MKPNKRHWSESRFLLGLVCIAGGIVLCAVLAFLFSLVVGMLPKFLRAWQVCIGVFGGAGVTAGLLLWLTNIPAEMAYGFGAGLYYGTFGVWWIAGKLGAGDSPLRWVASFVIAVIGCIVVRLYISREE